MSTLHAAGVLQSSGGQRGLQAVAQALWRYEQVLPALAERVGRVDEHKEQRYEREAVARLTPEVAAMTEAQFSWQSSMLLHDAYTARKNGATARAEELEEQHARLFQAKLPSPAAPNSPQVVNKEPIVAVSDQLGRRQGFESKTHGGIVQEYGRAL